MSDIIKLLPDALANQIAAGEVVQRPASVVKELMENALDAGADSIKLILKEGGKTLIQVIDDGKGMSETDARMAFERHATSKIDKVEDLFALRTMGFRGEALASIAAVAQVELKTKTHEADLGTRILIEGSNVITQEPCQCETGTSVAVKNLFFNVPARKQFLKKDHLEAAHAEAEFIRIAMAYPEIKLSMFLDDREAYRLAPGNLRQRINSIFKRKDFTEVLVPVEETTDLVTLKGYIGTPETAKKRRGDQFLFVNGRFIKSHYLNHAVATAYEDILPEGRFPFFAIFLEVDPSKIDVNVHPTKQEIKFEDERIIYNYLKVAAKYALSKYHVAPTLDFDQDRVFKMDNPPSPSTSSGSKNAGASDWKKPAENRFATEEKREWMSYYEQIFNDDNKDAADKEDVVILPSQSNQQDEQEKKLFTSGDEWTDTQPHQIHQSYIMCHIRSGIIIVDQQAAHERILFEKYMADLKNGQASVQKLLFPKVVSVQGADIDIVNKLVPIINEFGVKIEPFGESEFIIHGTPSMKGKDHDPEELIHQLIDQYKSNIDLDLNLNEKAASALAKSTAMKRGRKLSNDEMQSLVDQLFSCEMPYTSPMGRKCFITLDLDDLEKRFKKN